MFYVIRRAKLFIYGESLLDKGKGVKSWNERGVGEFRILKHKETHHLRVVMRQEKTMKIVANFTVDHRITLMPNAGNEKSWVWTCFDFAECELKETTFAIRFSDVESSTEFKNAFTDAQKEMETLLSGSDASKKDSSVDAAADALSGLSVAKDEVKKADEDDSDL